MPPPLLFFEGEGEVIERADSPDSRDLECMLPLRGNFGRVTSSSSFICIARTEPGWRNGESRFSCFGEYIVLFDRVLLKRFSWLDGAGEGAFVVSPDGASGGCIMAEAETEAGIDEIEERLDVVVVTPLMRAMSSS